MVFNQIGNKDCICSCTSFLGFRINMSMHIICKTSFPFQAYEEMEMSGLSHPHKVSCSTCEMGHISHYFVAVVLNQLLRE